VDDLIAAYEQALEHQDTTNGKAYNVGGGPDNTLSLLELIDLLEAELGYRLEYTFDDWRPGDQRVFVSDVERARRDFGWTPATGVVRGVRQLSNWLCQEAASVAAV
jgi:CDP-paratose 2-epimerase